MAGQKKSALNPIGERAFDPDSFEDADARFSRIGDDIARMHL